MKLKLDKPTEMWAQVKQGVIAGYWTPNLCETKQNAELYGRPVERVLVTVTRVPKAIPCPVLKSKRLDLSLAARDAKRRSRG